MLSILVSFMVMLICQLQINIMFKQKMLVGNYPFIDFFINARIKPVRIFIKIDHITQGYLGNNYTLTPGYLQNDRAFKFGINWLFSINHLCFIINTEGTCDIQSGSFSTKYLHPLILIINKSVD